MFSSSSYYRGLFSSLWTTVLFSQGILPHRDEGTVLFRSDLQTGDPLQSQLYIRLWGGLPVGGRPVLVPTNLTPQGSPRHPSRECNKIAPVWLQSRGCSVPKNVALLSCAAFCAAPESDRLWGQINKWILISSHRTQQSPMHLCSTEEWKHSSSRH